MAARSEQLDRMYADVRWLTAEWAATGKPELAREADALRGEWLATCEAARSSYWRPILAARERQAALYTNREAGRAVRREERRLAHLTAFLGLLVLCAVALVLFRADGGLLR